MPDKDSEFPDEDIDPDMHQERSHPVTPEADDEEDDEVDRP